MSGGVGRLPVGGVGLDVDKKGCNQVRVRRAYLLRPWGVVGWAASPRRATLPHTNCSNGSLSKIALMKGDLVACMPHCM